MTRIARVLWIVLVAVVVPAAAIAQEGLAKRVSLDLKAMAPAEAFKVLADAVGTKVLVDPAVTTPVDIVVRNVSARTALNTICESIGCRWTTDANGITVKPAGRVGGVTAPRIQDPRARARRERVQALFKQPLPAGMKFENATLDAVSKRLSAAFGVSISITAEDATIQTVTADFSNLSLQDALRVLVDTTGSKRVVWRLAITMDGDEKAAQVLLAVGGKKQQQGPPQKLKK
jgi:hypothetical protein